MGKHINRVAGNQDDGLGFLGDDLIDEAFDDAGVLLEQIEAGFARRLLCPGSDDDHVGISEIFIFANINVDRWVVGQAMRQVQNLAFGILAVNIDQGDLVSQAFLCQRVCKCRANCSRANDNDFTRVVHGFHSLRSLERKCLIIRVYLSHFSAKKSLS